MDQPLSELRKTLPELEPENQTLRISQASQVKSGGICPDPSNDVFGQAEEWEDELSEDDFYAKSVGHKKPNEKRNYLTVEDVFQFLNLESESSLVVARNILLDRAILEAKANIITSLYANFSADTYTDFPESGTTPTKEIHDRGRDLAKKKEEAREERDEINEELERVSEAVIEADEDAMAGVGIVDQLERFIGAASTKLDESLKREDITAEEERRVKTLKGRLQGLQNRKKTIEIELEALDNEMAPYAQAVVSASRAGKLASQSLYGTHIVQQFFCYNKENRSAALLVRLAWSSKNHKEAEATMLRQEFNLERTEDISFERSLRTRETGEPSNGRHTDPDGTLNWYSVRQMERAPGNITRQRQTVRVLAEGQLVRSLYAEVGTQIVAEEALADAADGSSSFTTQFMVGKMEEKANDIALSGVQGRTGITENPFNGEDMLFHVAWLDPTSARNSEEIVKLIEATNFRFHKDQSYWKAKFAGMRAMGASTKNDPDAARAGFNEGVNDVASEINKTSSDNSDSETERKEKIGLEKSRRWQSET